MHHIFRRMASTSPKASLKNLEKVAFFSARSYEKDYFNKFNDKAKDNQKLEFDYYSEGLSARTARLVSGAGTACAFVNDKLDEPCLKVLKDNGVQLLALRSAGFSNVDMKAAEKLGLKVVRVPAYSPYAVAEHVMALLLTLNRHTHKAYNRTKEGNFKLSGLMGFDLHGKTMGIVGGGKIGQCLASICKGFGMKMFYYDVTSMKEMEELGAKKVELEELLKGSDVVSLHCPLSKETEHIINEKTLGMMKEEAILINTARGPLIDTKAVVEALKKDKLGGLGIDVVEGEEEIFFTDHYDDVIKNDELNLLLTFPNVIVTGHQAFFTKEAMEAIATGTIENILEVKESGKCKNEVEPPKEEDDKKDKDSKGKDKDEKK